MSPESRRSEYHDTKVRIVITTREISFTGSPTATRTGPVLARCNCLVLHCSRLVSKAARCFRRGVDVADAPNSLNSLYAIHLMPQFPA